MVTTLNDRLTNLVLKVIPDAWHPNHITGARILLIPLVWAFYYHYSALVSAIMFALLALTDFIDGRLARGRGLVSHFGKQLDIGCDLVLVWSTVVLLVQEDIILSSSHPWLLWLPVFMFAREIVVTTVRLLFRVRPDEVYVLKVGKCKTGFFMISLTVLLTSTVFAESLRIGTLLCAVAAGCSFLSGVQYVHQFTSIAQRKKEKGE